MITAIEHKMCITYCILFVIITLLIGCQKDTDHPDNISTNNQSQVISPDFRSKAEKIATDYLIKHTLISQEDIDPKKVIIKSRYLTEQKKWRVMFVKTPRIPDNEKIVIVDQYGKAKLARAVSDN